MGSDLLYRIAGVVVLGLAVSGCSRQAIRSPEPAEAQSIQGNHEVPEAWHLSARLAVSNGQDGGSGRLEWTQQGAFFDVTLRAPVSGQNWQLLGDETGCQLQGLRPEPILARSPEELLRRELQWELPVGALRSWLFGLGSKTAEIERDREGRITRLRDLGWTIDYKDWQNDQGYWLPKRLIAKKPPYQVRLAVGDWRLDDAIAEPTRAP
ncbi:MAG: outer membrane lipoprotein LolB [Ahniella sp.]|nr:outer membrane lipoprotein LolB [Ahniella sp.]